MRRGILTLIPTYTIFLSTLPLAQGAHKSDYKVQKILQVLKRELFSYTSALPFLARPVLKKKKNCRIFCAKGAAVQFGYKKKNACLNSLVLVVQKLEKRISIPELTISRQTA